MKRVSGIGLIALLICFFCGSFSQQVHAVETTTITLHRVLFTGEEAEAFDNQGGRPLKDVKLGAYDVSEKFYQLVNEGKTPQQAQKAISEAATEAVENDGLNKSFTKAAEDQLTKEDGTVTYVLPTYHSGTLGKVYLFVEKSVPNGVNYQAGNLVVGLPQAESMVDDVVHLYFKNQLVVRKPYFHKYGQDATGKDEGVLAGAEFQLYKLVNNEKYYLQEEPFNNGNQWVPSGEAGIVTFISDRTGKVSTGEYALAPGTYYFEETKAPSGYEITEQAKKIQVDIPSNSTEKITVTIDDKGILMEEAKVFNRKTTEPPGSSEPEEPEEPTTPSLPSTGGNRLPSTAGGTSTSSTKSLPRTGTRNQPLLIIFGGILLIGFTWILYKRNQPEEEK
ncbi:pilin N-terminal domain-containing protein [Enterococcus florum]|nr:pilin N-terminal domain-containing protein [Enterococcus florum]